MTNRTPEENDTRDLLLRILPLSASMAGFSIAAITVFRSSEKLMRVETMADDLLVSCAAVFLLATYLSFWALKTHRPARQKHLVIIIDSLFLLALTVLVAVGFLMVYTLL